MNRDPIEITQRVTEAINEELNYQIGLSSASADSYDYGVAGQLILLRRYSQKAEDAWVSNAGDVPALHELRKCAAIAVRALLKYGCPKRGEYEK